MIPKICDFGLSHVITREDNKCYLEVLCGTKGYMAPEQKAVSFRIFKKFRIHGLALK